MADTSVTTFQVLSRQEPPARNLRASELLSTAIMPLSTALKRRLPAGVPRRRQKPVSSRWSVEGTEQYRTLPRLAEPHRHRRITPAWSRLLRKICISEFRAQINRFIHISVSINLRHNCTSLLSLGRGKRASLWNTVMSVSIGINCTMLNAMSRNCRLNFCTFSAIAEVE